MIIVNRKSIPSRDELCKVIYNIAEEKGYKTFSVQVINEPEGFCVIVFRSFKTDLTELYTIYGQVAFDGEPIGSVPNTCFLAIEALHNSVEPLVPELPRGDAVINLEDISNLSEKARLLINLCDEGFIDRDFLALFHLSTAHKNLFESLWNKVKECSEKKEGTIRELKENAAARTNIISFLQKPEARQLSALSTIHTVFYANLSTLDEENNPCVTFLQSFNELKCESRNFSGDNLDYYWFDSNDVIPETMERAIRINFFGESK